MKQSLYVGTYTEPILFGTGEVFQGKGRGIYRCAFDGEDITCESVTPLRNPSFLCVHEDCGRIYAVNEMKEFEGQSGGGMTALAYDAQRAEPLEARHTGGGDPCHIVMSPDRSMLVVSNFADGSVAVYRLDSQGNLLAGKQLFQHQGSSVHPVRQRGPHAHSAIFADNYRFFVPDLGMDQLVAYRCEKGRAQQDPAHDVRLEPGSGPRFGEFSADGKHFYLINELASSVTHFLWDGEAMTPQETVNTLPEGFDESNICSDLHLTPDGKYLYASNRGHDSIAAFRVKEDGSLHFLARTPCQGKTPRNFAIDPLGRHLLVGNQDSDTIAVFDLGEDGGLRLRKVVGFPTPVCIRFLRQAAL